MPLTEAVKSVEGENFQKLSIKVTYLATGTMIKGAAGYFSTE